MRIATSLRFGSMGLMIAGAALAWACSKNAGNAGAETDAGDDGDASEDVAEDPGFPPITDSSMQACMVNGTDPVQFCLQKQVLGYELTNAYAKGVGVPPSWDSTTGMPGSPHSWRDDVGFASSVGSFHCSAAVYGDTTLAPMLDAIMPDLGSVIVQELPAAPSGYDGEDYFRLRGAATGLAYANDVTDAAKVSQIADAFGQNLQSMYAQTVTLPEGGTATVLGTADGMGNVVYAPAQVIMAAAALVDMANIHASDADAGTTVPTWVATALAAVDYVWTRGRDTTTGLFFQQLVTSSDPGHDALGQGTPTPDALLTDVQAEAVLGLARLQDGVNALPTLDGGVRSGVDASALSPSLYWNEANTVVQSLVGAGLFDGLLATGEEGIPDPAPPGAFMEALIPSTSAIDTNKTTLGNAWLLGAVHRVGLGMPSQVDDSLQPQLLAAVAQQTPANTSLYTIITDPKTGNPDQFDYVRAGSKDFQLATVFSPDGGTGGPESGATAYRADATAAVIEGLTQLWRGTSATAPCSQ